jgi:hypothetical protein
MKLFDHKDKNPDEMDEVEAALKKLKADMPEDIVQPISIALDIEMRFWKAKHVVVFIA